MYFAGTKQHEHKQGTALGAVFASCRTFVLRKLHLIDLIGASRSKETKDFSDDDGDGDDEDFSLAGVECLAIVMPQ